MLFIDPDQYIDCYACVEECPENAIFQEYEVPEKWQKFIPLNAEMSQVRPSITEQRVL